MKSYIVKAANEAGRWRYIGIFAHPIDAALHAMDQGATRVSVKPIESTKP